MEQLATRIYVKRIYKWWEIFSTTIIRGFRKILKKLEKLNRLIVEAVQTTGANVRCCKYESSIACHWSAAPPPARDWTAFGTTHTKYRVGFPLSWWQWPSVPLTITAAKWKHASHAFDSEANMPRSEITNVYEEKLHSFCISSGNHWAQWCCLFRNIWNLPNVCPLLTREDPWASSLLTAMFSATAVGWPAIHLPAIQSTWLKILMIKRLSDWYRKSLATDIFGYTMYMAANRCIPWWMQQPSFRPRPPIWWLPGRPPNLFEKQCCMGSRDLKKTYRQSYSVFSIIVACGISALASIAQPGDGLHASVPDLTAEFWGRHWSVH